MFHSGFGKTRSPSSWVRTHLTSHHTSPHTSPDTTPYLIPLILKNGVHPNFKNGVSWNVVKNVSRVNTTGFFLTIRYNGITNLKGLQLFRIPNLKALFLQGKEALFCYNRV